MNRDYSESVAMDCNQQSWHANILPGIEVIPLEAESQNHGLTTFVARIPAGRSLALPQSHAEVFIVSGSMLLGDTPCGADSYVHMVKHGLVATEDCLVFVKSGITCEQDMLVDATARQWLPGEYGCKVIPLYQQGEAHSALWSWLDAQTGEFDCHFGGTEILLLEGTVTDDGTHYPALSWLRYPHRYDHKISFSKAAKAFVKTGHLPLPL